MTNATSPMYQPVVVRPLGSAASSVDSVVKASTDADSEMALVLKNIGDLADVFAEMSHSIKQARYERQVRLTGGI